ncbi:MAG: hypothetical protein HYR75_06140 [Gemmatimonadetes bacterium]|nr:hypothetical protein [Gemmatimonadota bacterium]MBI3567050.1 hypothetical protein [Gemmatimonadota bacterium]
MTSAPVPTGAPAVDTVASLDALRLESDRRLVRTMLLVNLVPTVLTLGTDAMMTRSPSALEPFVLVRIAFVLGLLLFIRRFRRAPSRPAFEREVFVLALCTVVSVLFLQWIRPPDSQAIVRFAMLAVVGMYVVFPNRMILQLIPAVTLSITTSAILALRPSHVSAADRVLVPMILVLANVMGVVVARRRDRLYASEARLWRAEQDARSALERTLSELRVLRGVVPICSHCRKIRTEVGDWQQLEQYVRDHSDADFSHGVCPECTALHYPQVAAELRAERGEG